MRKSVKKSLNADVCLSLTFDGLVKKKSKAICTNAEYRQQQNHNRKRQVVAKTAKYLLALLDETDKMQVRREIEDVRRLSYTGVHFSGEESGRATPIADQPSNNRRPIYQSSSPSDQPLTPALSGMENFSEFHSHAIGVVEREGGPAARAATNEEVKVSRRTIKPRPPRRREACKRLDMY
eukprot:TRINITY_DN7086_c0_g1_i21.p1 TRINITY_DN7086_c0_g1~~TRINITY_DN7086_c0_g1_i21.p1  ORF type:complete len:180 (-),score=0.84 TRINITY_DN7086_c0_g1_i21:188-727(-)